MKKYIYIFGDPVEHSKSPDMHNAAYQALGIQDKFEYQKRHVKPPELAKAVESLRSKNCAGANITFPHKENVIQYLDKVDKIAKEIGAVNTVINKNGKLIGYNTDGAGFIESLKRYNNFEIKNKNIALLGAGGAAKAIAYMLAKEKAKSISIGEIDLIKASALADKFTVAKAYQVNSADFHKKIKNAQLVINTTPLGMAPLTDKTPLADTSVIHKGQLFADIVYAPRNTVFLKNAMMKGAQVSYGYGMLLWQGVIAFHYFTNISINKIPIKIMENILTK